MPRASLLQKEDESEGRQGEQSTPYKAETMLPTKNTPERSFEAWMDFRLNKYHRVETIYPRDVPNSLLREAIYKITTSSFGVEEVECCCGVDCVLAASLGLAPSDLHMMVAVIEDLHCKVPVSTERQLYSVQLWGFRPV